MRLPCVSKGLRAGVGFQRHSLNLINQHVHQFCRGHFFDEFPFFEQNAHALSPGNSNVSLFAFPDAIHDAA